MITGITVPQDSGATQDDTGKVSLSAKIRDYTLNFPTTSLTRRLRLTVFQADLGTRTNFVLTEVIVSGEGRRSNIFLLEFIIRRGILIIPSSYIT